MRDAVKLDEAQVATLNKILDETHDDYDHIRQSRDAAVEPIIKKYSQENQALRDTQIGKIKAMLRDDQQPLYAKYLADRDAERKKRQQEHPDRKDGKGPGFHPSRP
jgi:hypothetical protein